MADAPIGIFDSGFGGLTVARAVLDQLPHEPVLYFGDTARQPYGPRPIAEVREYALECLDHLVDQGVKMLVIACNSASAAVLRDARERYDVPVVEVIQPAVRRAVAATRNGRVGVICTVATKTSRAYEDAFAAAPARRASPPRPARGSWSSSRRASPAAPSCSPWRTSTSTRWPRAGVDTLILGCTHYPLLTGVISYVMGDGVTLVSSAEETAKDVYRDPASPSGLERAGRAARAGAPVPHHRRPRPVPRRSAGGSSAPRSAACEQLAWRERR